MDILQQQIKSTRNPNRGLRISFTDTALESMGGGGNWNLKRPSLQSLPLSVPRSTSFKAVKTMEGRKEKLKKIDDNGFSRSSWLSALYALIVSLVGFVLFMTEALTETWMESHLIAVFLTYLHSASCIFTLYAIIYEGILKDKQKKKERKAELNPVNSSDSLPPSYHSKTDDDGAVQNQGFDFEEAFDVESCSLGGSVFIDATTPNSEYPEAAISTYFGGAIVESTQTKSVATQCNTLPRLRSHSNDNTESIAGSSLEPSDDVLDYIAMHFGQVTLSDGGSSYFLKGGTLVFAIANMVYVALRIEGEHYLDRCAENNHLIYPSYVHLVFIVLQTFFLLKETKHACRHQKPLARFGLMHLLAANMCVWLRFLLVEVGEGLMHSEGHSAMTTWALNMTENQTEGCESEPIMYQASPYLFPFILEYSLVAVSSVAFMYSSVSIRVSTEVYKAVRTALQTWKRGAMGHESGAVSRKHGMFEKSHTGLFLGVIVLAALVVSMVLFFYWKREGNLEAATLCYAISQLVLLVLLLVNCIIGMVYFSSFTYDANESNILDHALLLVSVTFYIIIQLFQFLVYCHQLSQEPSTNDVMFFVIHIISVIQGIMQTAFLMDGMQRVAIKEKDIIAKRGRGAVTFLIVANIAMWVSQSFQEKKVDQELEYEVFGDVAWIIIHSIAVPMMLFFRFHSSICLAHMWHHSFEPHHEAVENTMVL